MSSSSSNPFKRIADLEKQICCLKKENKNEFISDVISVNFANPVDAVLETTAGFNIGVGVSDTYADIAALIVALNTAYTGLAVFTLYGLDKIKIVTTDNFEILTLNVSN